VIGGGKGAMGGNREGDRADTGLWRPRSGTGVSAGRLTLVGGEEGDAARGRSGAGSVDVELREVSATMRLWVGRLRPLARAEDARRGVLGVRRRCFWYSMGDCMAG